MKVKDEPLSQKDRNYFRQERKEVEALIPDGTMRVLDVGCGEGILGKRLLDKGSEEVVGIEINAEVAKKAEENLSKVLCGDVETLELPFEEKYFDCILFADLLEHLKDPLTTLKRFGRYLKDTGVVVASIPNVRYYGVMHMLSEGRWKYEDAGILDRTHLRFFTRKEIETLFKDAGYEITGISANIDPAYNRIDPLSKEIAFGRLVLKGLNPEELQDLFIVQYLIKAQRSEKRDDAINAAIHSGNLRNAKKLIEGHLEIHPADLDMLYRYAEVSHRLGMLHEALESIERILLFEPERKDALELKQRIVEAG